MCANWFSRKMPSRCILQHGVARRVTRWTIRFTVLLPRPPALCTITSNGVSPSRSLHQGAAPGHVAPRRQTDTRRRHPAWWPQEVSLAGLGRGTASRHCHQARTAHTVIITDTAVHVCVLISARKWHTNYLHRRAAATKGLI